MKRASLLWGQITLILGVIFMFGRYVQSTKASNNSLSRWHDECWSIRST